MGRKGFLFTREWKAPLSFIWARRIQTCTCIFTLEAGLGGSVLLPVTRSLPGYKASQAGAGPRRNTCDTRLPHVTALTSLTAPRSAQPVWAFHALLVHLRPAQCLGSGLEQHYLWLLMTSPKPTRQFKYPHGRPASVSTTSGWSWDRNGGSRSSRCSKRGLPLPCPFLLCLACRVE